MAAICSPTSPKSPSSVGVDDKQHRRRDRYATWHDGTIPPGYGETISRSASKWGEPNARHGRHRQLLLHHGVQLDASEKEAWQGGFALWSAVANINFAEQPTPPAQTS